MTVRSCTSTLVPRDVGQHERGIDVDEVDLGLGIGTHLGAPVLEERGLLHFAEGALHVSRADRNRDESEDCGSKMWLEATASHPEVPHRVL